MNKIPNAINKTAHKDKKSFNTQVYELVCIRLKLKRREKLLFFKFLGFLLRNDKPISYSIEKLCENTGYSKRPVFYALNTLEKYRIINRVGFTNTVKYAKGSLLIKACSLVHIRIKKNLYKNCELVLNQHELTPTSADLAYKKTSISLKHNNKDLKEKEKEKEKRMAVIDLTPQKNENENENGEEMKREYSVGPFDATMQEKKKSEMIRLSELAIYHGEIKSPPAVIAESYSLIKKNELSLPESTQQEIQEDCKLASLYDLEVVDLLAFDSFWSAYPGAKNKIRARELWFSSGCHKIASQILLKLSEQATKDEHFLTGFNPSACNYISGRRWEDKIEEKKSKVTFNHGDTSWAEKRNPVFDYFDHF